ncbi:MAG: class I SAM-dependent methyltransferase [Gaiellaceae bacterium]
MIADVGCGTGHALVGLARTLPAGTKLIGIEPADGMRERAAALAADTPAIEIKPGSFEQIPLEDSSVDFLFSIFAFHWSTDVEQGAREVARVVRDGGMIDLCFIGRDNGREFIRATSKIFLRYLGARGLLEAAQMRTQLTRDEAESLFAGAFGGDATVEVTETHITYYDTLERHWDWWVRIEGQFVSIPEDTRDACAADVKRALAGLEAEGGIPYTLHELRVRLVAT